MARIAGVNIPTHKHIVIGLTAIYGIGRSRSMKICQETKIDPTTKVKDLAEAELDAIRAILEKYELEGDLRRKEAMDIKRLMELGTYRGTRHRRGLPARGQRTRSNARTAKRGNKGARKKQAQPQKAEAK